MHKEFWLEKTKESGHFEGPDVGVKMKWIINNCRGIVWTFGDADGMYLRNVWSHLPCDSASHSRRPESSITRLCKPQNSDILSVCLIQIRSQQYFPILSVIMAECRSKHVGKDDPNKSQFFGLQRCLIEQG